MSLEWIAERSLAHAEWRDLAQGMANGSLLREVALAARPKQLVRPWPASELGAALQMTLRVGLTQPQETSHSTLRASGLVTAHSTGKETDHTRRIGA